MALIRKARLFFVSEAWMTEKSFAATPYSCHDEILDVHTIMQQSIENFSMASDKIMSNFKDFEGIHAPLY